jgi:hypothetical protein
MSLKILESTLTSNWTMYAPCSEEGPLPPGFNVNTLQRVLEAERVRINPSLKRLGIANPLLEKDRTTTLLTRLNDSRHRREEALIARGHSAAFHEVIYHYSKKACPALYESIFEPAEVTKIKLNHSQTFLSCSLFVEILAQKREGYASDAETLLPRSDGECLALMVLAYGILQPDDAPALVTALLGLGQAYARWFGIPVASTSVVVSQVLPRSADSARPSQVAAHKITDTSLESSHLSAVDALDVQVVAATEAQRSLSSEALALEAVARELTQVGHDDAEALAIRLQTTTGRVLAAISTARAAWRAVDEARQTLTAFVEAMGIDVPALGRTTTREQWATDLRDWASRLQTLVAERAQERASLEERVRSFLGSASIDLGSDASALDALCSRVQQCIDSWELGEAQTALAQLLETRTTVFERRTRAVAAYERALSDLRRVDGEAGALGLAGPAPVVLANEARADAFEAEAAELQTRVREIERAVAVELCRRKEAERERQLEQARAEFRKATEPPSAPPDPSESLPSLVMDPCVAQLRAGAKLEPFDVVSEFDPRNLLRLLERLRALIETAQGDATRQVLEDLCEVTSTQRLAWAWSSAVRQPNHQLRGADMASVWPLVDALLDEDGGPSEALAIAVGLSAERVPEDVRERLFLWFGSRGVNARRQILEAARRLEPSGAPTVHAPYAWIHSLALIERSIAAPKDDAARLEALAYLSQLPRDDRASKALHTTMVREFEGNRPRKGAAPQSAESAAALATVSRKLLKERRSRPDRWSNEYLRAEEDDFLAACVSRLDDLERKGITAADVRALDPLEVSEKSVRKRLRRSGRSDPTGDGQRMARFMETLRELASSVERVTRARHLELSLTTEADPADDLRRHLGQLSSAQYVVAQALLTPPAGPAFTAVGDERPAIHVLESRLARRAGEHERPWLLAYLALRRGELAPLPSAPSDAEQQFVTTLRNHLHGKRERDISEIVELAHDCATRAAALELGYPELTRIVAQLEGPARLTANLDELLAKVLEIEEKLAQRADELAESSRVLLEDFSRHVGVDPLFARAHAEARRLHDGAHHRATVDLLRTAAEALDSDAPKHAAEARARLSQLLPKEEVAQLAEDAVWAEREQRLAHAFEARDRARDAWRDTSTIDALLGKATEAVASRDTSQLEEHLTAFDRALAEAALVSEPPATHDRSLYQLTLPPGDARVLRRADYFPLLTDEADEVRARAMLGSFAKKAPGDVVHALEAEAARLSARERAFRGDLEGVRLACECMYFLALRWGESWESKEKNFPAPVPPSDPLFAVSTLLACNIIARWVRAGAPGDPATWLGKLPHQAIREQHISAALAGHGEAGFVHELLRLLAAASYLPPDHEADLALIRGLRGMTTIGGDSGLIARVMGLFRHVDDMVRARWGLAKPLTVALHGEADFALQAFDQMFRSGRREDDIPVSERETYRGLRLTMERYAHATGRRLRPAWEKLLGATTQLVVFKSVRHMHAPLEAMRSVLAAMDFEIVPPHVRVALEEPFAVVDGPRATITLAIKNEGDDPVRELTLYSLPKSQFLLGTKQEPWRIEEPLESQQEIIHRVAATIVNPGHPGPYTLDLQVECRGINDAPVALPPLSLTVRPRQEAQIPKIERSVLQQLFYETGIEVSEQGKNFFGRDEELAELETRLLHKDPPDALLVQGMRRVGKTSLTKVFAAKAEKAGHRAVFVDFKQFAGPGEHESTMAPARSFGFLATRLLELPLPSGKRLATNFGYEGFKWKSQVIEDFKTNELPADMLREILIEVAQQLPGEGSIVFVVDELDYLVDPWEHPASRAHVYDLLNVLRGLIASQTGPLKRYRWVLCGSDRCKQMFESYDNPLYGSIAPITIKGVHPEDCEAMLEGPFGRCDIDVTEEALAEVFVLSQGFPFFINILGSRLCKVLATSPTDVISRWHVREAVALSMPANRQQEPPAPYDRLLEPIADRARTRGPVEEALLKLILGVIASRTSDAVPEVTSEAVISLVEKHVGTRVSRKQVMDTAHVLTDFDWVSETPREGDELAYQIRLPLLRRFVRDKYDYQIPVVAQRLIEAMGHG